MFYLFKAILVQIISYIFHICLIPPSPNSSDWTLGTIQNLSVKDTHVRKGSWPPTLDMQNNDRGCFWALTECMTVWGGVLHIFTCLIFITTHNNWYRYYLHFVDEETEIQKGFMARQWQGWELRPSRPAPGAVCLHCITLLLWCTNSALKGDLIPRGTLLFGSYVWMIKLLKNCCFEIMTCFAVEAMVVGNAILLSSLLWRFLCELPFLVMVVEEYKQHQRDN